MTADPYMSIPVSEFDALHERIKQAEQERDRLRAEWLEPTTTGRKFRELKVRLEQAEQAQHFCETEDGWRPCPPSLCEAERLYVEREQADKLAEAAKDLYERVEMDESVGICLSDRVPSLRLGEALREWEQT